MKMTFRWYGDDDPVTLKYIRQIPGMHGVVPSLFDIPAGEVWPVERIANLKQTINNAGLHVDTIESVNIHEDIKLGVSSRDQYIDNYIETIKRLGKAGMKVICYNFMPIFDWTRSDLAKALPDESTVLSYDGDLVKEMNPMKMVEKVEEGSEGFQMAGWDMELFKRELMDMFLKYQDVDEEALWKNLEYFLKAVIPEAEKAGIKMAIHADDPPWTIFGLPRIITSKTNLDRLVKLVDSPSNGITLCSGSFGAHPDNNIPDMIRHFGKMEKVHFGHVRNIKIHEPGYKFDEASHLTSDGSLDMYDIMRAYYDIGFEGSIRPDHGRMIWDEKGRPGYGLYDRALGVTYLNGLWEAICRENS